MKQKLLLSIALVGLLTTTGFSQNVYFAEPVQVVGTFNNFTTTPYGTDYRTTTYRKVSVPLANATYPTDGRGQWATTIRVASTGGDVMPINMPGGNAGGFLFISGSAANRFGNKWAFSSVTQGAINDVTTSIYQGSTDMGLDMSTPGYYTFVLNDFGYGADPKTKYFVSRTVATPVTVTRTSQVINANNTTTVNITTNMTPGPGENVFLRYVNGADFSGTTATTVVQATGTGVTYTATIPAPASTSTINYYVFTSTASNLTTASEIDKSLSTLRYDDNAGANYTASIVLPISLQYFNGVSNNEAIDLNWKSSVEINANNFDIEKLSAVANWVKIGTVAAANVSNSSYTFTDNAVSNGNNTYRLKLVDKDGKSSFSNVISINAVVAKGLKLYPTLVNSNSINVVFNEQKAGRATIKITSLNGKVLQQNTVTINEGNTVLQQTLPLLAKGNYVVTVNTAQVQKTFTIMVQ